MSKQKHRIMNTITDDKLSLLLVDSEISFEPQMPDYSTLNLEFNDPEHGSVLLECTNFQDGDFECIIYFNGTLTERELPKYQRNMIRDYMNEEEEKAIELYEAEKYISKYI